MRRWSNASAPRARLFRGAFAISLLLSSILMVTSSAVAKGPKQPSCDQRITAQLYGSGLSEAYGEGEAYASVILLTDTEGNLLPETSGTISWSYSSFVAEPIGNKAGPRFGGHLNFEILTADGHHITFRSRCIGVTGTLNVSSFGLTEGFLLHYADGIATGWPKGPNSPGQGHGARKMFVHFEAGIYPDGEIEMYVAMINGQHCNVDLGVYIWTPELGYGSGTHVATNHTSVATLDCSLLTGPGRSIPGGAPNLALP